jgi:hypothetical protein
MDSKRIYVDIPYSLKEKAKDYKIKWDADKKKWFSLASNTHIDKLEKVYLKVPYKDKDYVKKNGGGWDADVKCWYTLVFNTILTSNYELVAPDELDDEY